MLADFLRAGTRALHRRAERTGIVAELLHGRASVADYAVYLRNLLPVYKCLDHELVRRSAQDGWQTLAAPAMLRAESIVSDLEAICGAGWAQKLPVLGAAVQYCERIEQTCAEAAGGRFAAHVYTRLLGDLNGGRVLTQRLSETLGLRSAALQFYRFDLREDERLFTARYRRAFDELRLAGAAKLAALKETQQAFALNIALSEQVVGHRSGGSRAMSV
jgi:heme oxygenase